MDFGIREIYALRIRNAGLWNLEYSSLNPRISLTIGIRIPSSTDNLPEFSSWNPESMTWNPESKAVLDSLTFTAEGCSSHDF